MVSQLSTKPDPGRESFSLFRDDLLAFTRFTFPGYEASEHHGKLATKLERVARGKIKKLAVVMPPQRGKTELAAVRFMPWALGRDPDKRIIFVSYAAERAEKVSAEARDVVRTELYPKVFPGLDLSRTSQSVAHWQFAGHRGYVHAVGSGGPITGFGADLLIVDDPIKDREQADSELERQKLWDWYTSVALTRLSPDASQVIVHTRWHEDDLIGRLLANQPDEWDVLHLPAIDEGGAPLWPERWPVEAYERIRNEVGPRDWEALYQGNPVPSEGGLFKREWLRVVQQAPRLTRWVRYWDLAASVKEHGDYTSGALVGVDDVGCLWIADVVRFREEWPEARRRILSIVGTDPEGTLVGIEKVGFQLAAIQDLRNNDEFLRVPLFELTPDRDKYARAMAWAARAAEGRLALVNGPWVREFVDECVVFPYGRHDDQVDAVSGAVKLLVQSRGRFIEGEVAPNNASWEYFRRLGGIENPEEDGWD